MGADITRRLNLSKQSIRDVLQESMQLDDGPLRSQVWETGRMVPELGLATLPERQGGSGSDR